MGIFDIKRSQPFNRDSPCICNGDLLEFRKGLLDKADTELIGFDGNGVPPNAATESCLR